MHVDHIDGNGLNNQRSNLRIATRLQNLKNKVVQVGKIHSKYKGVCKQVCKHGDKIYAYWTALITSDFKRHYLGTFKTEEEAALAYNKKAVELHGEFANLNKL